MRNDDGAMEVSNEHKKSAQKNYHEKHWHTQSAWDMNGLSQADAVCNVTYLIDRDMVRESISLMKNGMITDLVNHIF